MAVRRKDENGENFPVYRSNPWMNELLTSSQTRNKIITSDSKDKYLVVHNKNTSTEENLPTGFYYKKKVEANQFVKLYTAGIAEVTGLSKPGARVFLYLFNEVSESYNKNKTEIVLKYEYMQEDERYFSSSGKPISKSTFYKGIKDLMQHGFIAQSEIPFMFFVNPLYMFNGDRLVIVQEFFKDKTKKIQENNEND